MNSLKVLVSLLLVSAIFAAGTTVTCPNVNGANQCSTQCPTNITYGSPATTVTWQQSGTGTTCQVVTCPSSITSGLVNATDAFCQSCGTSTSKANSAGTGCTNALILIGSLFSLFALLI